MKPVTVDFACGWKLPITEISNADLRAIVNGAATFEAEEPGEDPEIAVAIAAGVLRQRAQ